jgi:hypothetical protein
MNSLDSGGYRCRMKDASQLRKDQPRQQARRRDIRYSVPVFSIRIHTEILVDDQRYVGLLWDVSRSGACVRSFEKMPARQNVLIRFHDPSRMEVIERTGRLIWVDLVMKAYYAGMSFDQPIDSHNTFLSRLLEIAPPTPDRRAGEKSSRY